MLLDVNAPSLHEGYHARWSRFQEADEAPSLWRLEIPLSANGVAIGRLLIAGLPDQEPVWTKMQTLTKVVESYTQSPLTDSGVNANAAFTEVPGTVSATI